MNQHTTETVVVFTGYFIIIYLIGYFASRKTHSSADYLLGNRCFNPYITALAAGASDMGSWLLMALPGSIYLYGLSHIWMPVGLLIGAYLNWLFVAKRLRIATEQANNALTIPEYLAVRFHDKQDIIGLSLAILSLVFFSVYIASGFVALAILLSKFFALQYLTCLMIAVVVTAVYVLIGGFIAVNWVDMFQGILMLMALLVLPVLMFFTVHQSVASNMVSTTASASQSVADNMLTLIASAHRHLYTINDWSVVGVVSLLGWGLGYFGQPHILVRFMATKNPETIPLSRRIGMAWMFLCLLGAMAIGFLGAIIFHNPPLSNPDTIFIEASRRLYNPILAAILLSALVSAIMSTISAQILISSSALVEDIVLKIFKCKLSDKTELFLDRGAVILIILFATAVAINPDNNILSLVAYAWAGLGATLGPVILFALYSRKVTRLGAICGIVVGGLAALIWPSMKLWLGSGIYHVFDLYALVPAFTLSVLTIYLVSLCSQPIKS